MDVTVKTHAGNVTAKQDSFIQSLVNQASGLGYLFRGAICGSYGSRTEASLMIEMLLYLIRRPNRKMTSLSLIPPASSGRSGA